MVPDYFIILLKKDYQLDVSEEISKRMDESIIEQNYIQKKINEGHCPCGKHTTMICSCCCVFCCKKDLKMICPKCFTKFQWIIIKNNILK